MTENVNQLHSSIFLICILVLVCIVLIVVLKHYFKQRDTNFYLNKELSEKSKENENLKNKVFSLSTDVSNLERTISNLNEFNSNSVSSFEEEKRKIFNLLTEATNLNTEAVNRIKTLTEDKLKLVNDFEALDKELKILKEELRSYKASNNDNKRKSTNS